MNDTEKLILACFRNFGYYITTDGQFKIEGKMKRMPNYEYYNDIDVEHIDDYTHEEGLTLKQVKKIMKKKTKR